MKTIPFASILLLISVAFAGCLDDDSTTTINNNSGTSCWEILQISTIGINGGQTYTNLSYDSDCRIIASETMGMTYVNTTYDSDGNIATLETAVTVDQGATWYHSTSTQTYAGGLLMQTAMGDLNGGQTYTNFTYDSDDRVIVSETMGMTYVNTTYDSDGNVATLETAVTVDQGATWHHSTSTKTYVGGLLMQTATGDLNGGQTYTNFTYDSDDRVITSETMGMTYANTTYDSDGNIATLETAVTVDQGATWYHSTSTNLWGEP